MATPKKENKVSPLADKYPCVAALIREDGWIELGLQEYTRTYARALDMGGMLWSGGSRKMTLEELLEAMDDGLAKVFDELGIEV